MSRSLLLPHKAMGIFLLSIFSFNRSIHPETSLMDSGSFKSNTKRAPFWINVNYRVLKKVSSEHGPVFFLSGCVPDGEVDLLAIYGGFFLSEVKADGGAFVPMVFLKVAHQERGLAWIIIVPTP